MKRQDRPRRIIVSFRGIRYSMNLALCNAALVRRQVAGDFDSMEGLARAIGRSRSTASRFFPGRQVSLAATLAVLDKLRLQFDEVFTQCHPDLVRQQPGEAEEGKQAEPAGSQARGA